VELRGRAADLGLAHDDRALKAPFKGLPRG
jgi:hypothetical protein